jgi:hypothetical protein
MRKLASVSPDVAQPTDINFKKVEAWIKQHSAKWIELLARPKLTPDAFLESIQAAWR